MEYHILYVESRKSFKARSEKKLIISCSCSSNSMYINYNSIIALNKLKLSNGSINLPKLHMNQSMFSIGYTKSFEVKPQFNRHFDSKSYRILLNATILLLRYFGL